MKKTKLHLLLLLHKEGCDGKAVRFTTVMLSSKLGVSQQSVSRWLIQLENEGIIEKSRSGVRITEKGGKELEEVRKLISKPAFHPLMLQGTVQEGMGEGAYYLSLEEYRKQIRKAFNFEVFPGTLNLMLSGIDIERRGKIEGKEGVRITGFWKEGRFFGEATCYPCKIGNKVGGAVIIPKRTHYGKEVIEVIAAVDLRKTLKLKNGSKVEVKLLN